MSQFGGVLVPASGSQFGGVPIEEEKPQKDRAALAREWPQQMKDWRAGPMDAPPPAYPYSAKGRQEQLSARGVAATGAPSSVRALVSLAPERLQGKALQRMLVKHFKKPVKMRDGEDGPEFSTDEGKSWTLANAPGMDMGDVAGMAGTAQSLAGSMIGPFAGARVGAMNPVGGVRGKAIGAVGGAVLGGAVGTLFGEMTRFEEARRLGVIPEDTSDKELLNDAAQAAGYDLVGGTLGVGLLKAWKLYRARGTGKIKNIDVGSLEEDLAAAKIKTSEIEAASGQKFPVTTGQVLRPGTVRDEVLSVEEHVQREVPQGKLAGVEAQQRSVQRAVESNIQAAAPPPARSQMDIGADVRAAANIDPTTQVAGQEAIVAAKQAELGRIAQLAVSGSLTPTDAGRIARLNWREGKTAIQNAFHDRYDAMEAKHGGVAISTTGVRRAAIRHKRVLDQDLFPSLAPDDRTLIKDVLERTEGGKTISLSSAQRSLSALREEMRLMRKGTSPRRGIKEVQELHDAILNARNAAIERVGPNSTSPIRLQEVIKLERDYARSKEMIDRSALGALLKTKEGGGWITPDDAVIRNALSSESDMNEVVMALRDPAYAQHLGGERTLKRGVLGAYERAVMPDGELNLAAHKRFMAQPALGKLFSPDEMKRLSAPGAAAKVLKAEEEKLTELNRHLAKTTGVKMQDWDASAVISELWNPRGLERLNAVMAKTRSVDAGLADELKGAIAVRIRKDISDYESSTGEWLPNPKKMAEYLNSPEWVEAVNGTFGTHYLRALKVLHEAQTFANAAPVKRAQGGASDAIWRPHRQLYAMISRAGVAPPLSRAGRVQTGALNQKVSWDEARLDRLLSDPQAMIDLLKIRRLSPNSAAGAAAMADLARRIGADEAEVGEVQ